MIDEQKIIDFLTSDNLSIDQIEQFRKEYKDDPEFLSLVKIMDSLTYLAKEAHLDSDTIAEYALYLNGDHSKESEITPIIPRIEKHIQSCSQCRAEFELLNSELNEVDEFITDNIRPQEKEVPKQNIFFINPLQHKAFRYTFAAAASLIIMFSSLFVASNISTPKYVQMVNQFDTSNFNTTRGRNSENFSMAVNELEKENYEKAITLFKNDISNNQKDITIFYTYYILGITYMQTAHTDFLGMFDSYDQSKLAKAESSFKQAIALNSSGLFENVKYNSYFYLGESYLLQENFEQAEIFLTKAIESGSEYSSMARELLSTIK